MDPVEDYYTPASKRRKQDEHGMKVTYPIGFFCKQRNYGIFELKF